jgi:hypothetical protein
VTETVTPMTTEKLMALGTAKATKKNKNTVLAIV